MANDQQQQTVGPVPRFVETHPYSYPGGFDIETKYWEVTGAGPSSLTVFPRTPPGHSSAAPLQITPCGGTPAGAATKAYVGDGDIKVVFTHPPEDGDTYEWELSFEPPIGPLTVKIRKTRPSPLDPNQGS